MGSRDGSGANAARSLGWLLRAQYDDVVRDPLPARWVELINCMDEQERNRLKSELHLDDDETIRPLKN